jgi:hypothetical protein
MGNIWKASALLSMALGALWAQSSNALLRIPIAYWQAPKQVLLNSTEMSRTAHLSGRGGSASAMLAPALTDAAGATMPLTFVAITPCRLVDTRNGSGFTGAFGSPGLTSNVERTIPVPASSCGVPASAAYSLNFTVVPSGPLLYLSAYPTTFQNTSVLNSPTGQIIANGAVIPADSNGDFKVLASDPTNLIIDINGYYVPENFNFLATAATTANFEIGPVSGTGVNSGTHVAPGATTTLTANYSIAPVPGCLGCIEQVVVGIVGQANAQRCLYDSIPGGGVTNTGTVTLTAPSAPGIYFIGVRSALQFGCADALPGNTYGANIASLTVY